MNTHPILRSLRCPEPGCGAKCEPLFRHVSPSRKQGRRQSWRTAPWMLCPTHRVVPRVLTPSFSKVQPLSFEARNGRTGKPTNSV